MTTPAPRGLLDTSVFIAVESGCPLRTELLPDLSYICPITLAELQAGVLSPSDVEVRAQRLATLNAVADIEMLPIDSATAMQWARLRVHLASAGRRVNVNDLWIAAVAVANRIPVVTQDDDFNPLHGISDLKVVRV